MLKISLDELVPPELIKAFQQQWAASDDASLAQATDALRLLTAPRDEAERFVAKVILSLVGPNPDAFAWLEALAKGRFGLADAVTVTITRVKESPAQSIKRQQDRIVALAQHKGHLGDKSAIENVYTDALRLLVAVSLLTRMRQSVESKAALGAAWAPMVAVMDYCDTDEKKVLFLQGDDSGFQEVLGFAIKEVIARFSEHSVDVATKAEVAGRLPPDTNPYSFFAKQSESFKVDLRKPLPIVFSRPGFVVNPTTDEMPNARHRALLLMPSLAQELTPFDSATAAKGNSPQAFVAFSLAYRSQQRRIARINYLKKKDGSLTLEEWNVQTAIWRHLRAGLFLPLNLPGKFMAWFEEDLAWFYHQQGKRWIGFNRWHAAGYLYFEPDRTKINKLSF